MGAEASQAKEQISIRFSEGISLPDEPRKSASEQSLDVVGYSSFFVRKMSIFRKNGGIGFS
jgi:hypothetical protein